MAVSYIKDNLYENLSRDMLSEYTGISPANLSTLFHRETGVSIPEYISSARIEHAKELLLNSSLSVEEIARKCGFSSERYFRKIFRDHAGCSAGDYRTNHQ